MGRISNVVSLRGNSKNLSGTLLLGHSHNLKILSKLIPNLFFSKKVTSLGFVLSGVRLEEFAKGSGTHLIVSIYESDSLPFTDNYRVFKFSYKRLGLHLLFLERLILSSIVHFGYKEVYCSFRLVCDSQVSAFLVCNYITIKLNQQYPLWSVLSPLARFLKQERCIKGFRISCSGRFSRKQRASRALIKGGETPFSAMGESLQYAENRVILKYGSCGVKVWLLNSQSKEQYTAEIVKIIKERT